MDKARLTKLMAMTTSDNDGEALNALRMANTMLKAEKVTWEDVLSPTQNTVTISVHRQPPAGEYQDSECWTAPHLKDKVVLDRMFMTIYASLGPADTGFRQFIDSVHKWYRDHGQVSNGQYQALRRAYTRASRAPA